MAARRLRQRYGDNCPVLVAVTGREKVTVPAGVFATVVVEMRVRQHDDVQMLVTASPE